jgi:hypothetical protein
MKADSSSSLGMERKNYLSIKIANTETTLGTIRAA